MPSKNKLLLTIIFLLIIISIFFIKKYYHKEAIQIDIAVPLTGLYSEVGKNIKDGIDLYVNEINSGSGVNGKKIIIETHDDKNNVEEASKVAKNIVVNNRSIAVIGHWNNKCSRIAGILYNKHQIPAISVGSTAVSVSSPNDWYFSSLPNDYSQFQFLAKYATKILEKKVFILIFDNSTDYGSYLNGFFQAVKSDLKLHDLIIKEVVTRENSQAKILKLITKIVNDIKIYNHNNVELSKIIFLATNLTEGIHLVKLIKDENIDIPIMTSDLFDSHIFKDGFIEEKKEKEKPGYYTDGIYIATQLIFDTANQKAQQFKKMFRQENNQDPNWISAYAYDTIMILIKTLLKNNIQCNPDTLKEDRKKLKESLSNIREFKDSIKGVTGDYYFDSSGNSQKKNISIGIFKNNKIISALTQLNTLNGQLKISQNRKNYSDSSVFQIEKKWMYKTNVVYTGIKYNTVSDIDLKEQTYMLDFYIWFRFQGKICPEDIEFINAVEPIKLGKAEEVVNLDNISYKLFRLNGMFKNDFDYSNFSRKQSVGICFRHRTLTRNKLIYVVDVLAMNEEQEKKVNNIKNLSQKIIFSDSSWTIKDIELYEEIAEKNSLGNPYILELEKNSFSVFHSWLQIQKKIFFPRFSLPKAAAIYSTVFCFILFIVNYLCRSQNLYKRLPKTIFCIKIILIFLLMISFEIILIDFIQNDSLIIVIFDILWFFVPSYILIKFIRFFLIRNKSSNTLLILSISTFIYLMALFGVLHFVLYMDINKLTSIVPMAITVITFIFKYEMSDSSNNQKEKEK